MRSIWGGLIALLASLLSIAGAHATLVIGTLTFDPDPPPDGEEVTVSIRLEDPSLVEVEDAVIFLELRDDEGLEENEQPTGEALHITDRMEEVAPGVYRAQLLVPAGDDSLMLSVRDRTYRQEEAVANVPLDFSGPVGEIVFVLPPTAIGPASLGTWLIWLIVVPLLAGVLVTVLVLRGGKDDEQEDDPDGATDDGATLSDGAA